MASEAEEALTRFQPVAGEAGVKRSSVDSGAASCPVVFVMSPHPGGLRVLASDFHDDTWQSTYSPADLQFLKEEAGISNEFPVFLAHLHDSFSSRFVRLVAPPPDGAVRDGGPARLEGRKGEKSLQLQLTLERAPAGAECRAAQLELARELLACHRQALSRAGSEAAGADRLAQELVAEKARTRDLLLQLEANAIGGGSRAPKKTQQRASQAAIMAAAAAAAAATTSQRTQLVPPPSSPAPLFPTAPSVASSADTADALAPAGGQRALEGHPEPASAISKRVKHPPAVRRVRHKAKGTRLVGEDG